MPTVSVAVPTHNEAASPTLKELLPGFSHRSPSQKFVEKSMSTERNQQKAAQKTAVRSAILVRGHTGKLGRSAHSVRSIATLVSGVLPSWSGLDVNKITVNKIIVKNLEALHTCVPALHRSDGLSSSE